MHSYPADIDGTTCAVYFFRTWAGYAHPVTLIDPIDFDEAQSLDAYYRGYFAAQADGVDLLVRCDKCINRRMPVAVENPPNGVEPGHVYIRVDSLGGELRTMDAAAAATSSEYGHLVMASDRTVATAERMALVIEYGFRYHYGASGALERVVVRRRDGAEQALDY